VPVDFLGPLLLAVPELAKEILATLRCWGVNRWSLDWRTAGIRELMDRLEDGGWPVNVYGIPDLEAFLEASLLLPSSVTADFNFPGWHYFGRGSGQHRAYHRYDFRADRPDRPVGGRELTGGMLRRKSSSEHRRPRSAAPGRCPGAASLIPFSAWAVPRASPEGSARSAQAAARPGAGGAPSADAGCAGSGR
jgi:hypothetical protein